MTDFQEFFPRDAEDKINQWLSQNYLVALLGARQTGKTTLLQKIAASQKNSCFYYSFDDLMLRNKAAADFFFLQKDLEARLGQSLKELKKEIFLFIDEAQKEPSVFDFLKMLHDNFRDQIRIIISGSASLEIQKQTSESLVGRAQYVYLFPLSLGEIIKQRFNLSQSGIFDRFFEKEISLSWLKKQQSLLYACRQELEAILEQILVFGLLPGTWQRKPQEKMAYLRSIVSLYLEKDIRSAGLVKELENFQNLLQTLSFQVGSSLNLANLSSQTGVSVNTLRSYRSILKNTFVFNPLFPFIKSPAKRTVKNPKAYFYDIGVANFLAGREKIENVLDSKASGGIFENIILKSLEAFAKNQTVPMRSFYWRDYQGREVDLVLQKGEKIIPIEITYSSRLSRKKLANLNHFLLINKQSVDFGLIIYRGELKSLTFANRPVFCLPWWLWW